MAYKCKLCDHTSIQWVGKCPGCGEFGSMNEVPPDDAQLTDRATWKALGWNVDAGGKPRRLTEIHADELTRFPTGIGELDRVLGVTGDVSGFVPDEVVLFAGEPGVGKSTILLQVADRVAKTAGPVLYASGEESLAQIRIRADRIGVDCPDIHMVPETDIASIVEAVRDIKPKMLIVDSIQTMRLADIESSPGSPSQVRACAEALLNLAKTTSTPIFLVGHVTKEGTAAGPRLLEHMIDAMLYLEGERNNQYRVLRAQKNRFGSTYEIGIFEMTDKGLLEVPNPSEQMLKGRDPNGSGSVVVPIIDGLRPMLLELQVLTSEGSMGTPRRSVVGADKSRVDMVMAVASRKTNLAALSVLDVYVNVVGGLRATEPGADLAIALAAASSVHDIAIPKSLVVIGELGLTGEVRDVNGIERRVMEAARMGFSKAMVPASSTIKVSRKAPIELVRVATIGEAVRYVLGEAADKTPRRAHRDAVSRALEVLS